MAMLALRPTPSSPNKPCTPHLLPLRINHNGPINATQRHWTPSVDNNGTHHVHFRGRHLHGTALPLPAKYTGLVLRTTDKPLPHEPLPYKPLPQTSNAHPTPPHQDSNPVDDDDDDEGEGRCVQELEEEVRVMEEMGTFEEVVVWGHGGVVGEGDEFVRGVGEWVGFAEGVHLDSESEGEEGEGEGEAMEGVKS